MPHVTQAAYQVALHPAPQCGQSARTFVKDGHHKEVPGYSNLLSVQRVEGTICLVFA